MINELYTAMLNGEPQATTEEMLNHLMDYTHRHFAAEEALRTLTSYPHLEPHIAMHRALTREVNKYREEFRHGHGVANLPMLHFLNEWLTTHIMKQDKQYAPWMAGAQAQLPS
jgi:hemerythrin-like metal-binding protein